MQWREIKLFPFPVWPTTNTCTFSLPFSVLNLLEFRETKVVAYGPVVPITSIILKTSSGVTSAKRQSQQAPNIFPQKQNKQKVLVTFCQNVFIIADKRHEEKTSTFPYFSCYSFPDSPPQSLKPLSGLQGFWATHALKSGMRHFVAFCE